MANGGTAICPGATTRSPTATWTSSPARRRSSTASSSASSTRQVRKSEPVFTRRGAQGVPRRGDGRPANVEVKIFANLLVDFAREIGASVIVKGLRAISDFEYEFEMNQLNRKLAPDIESMYVIASPAY